MDHEGAFHGARFRQIAQFGGRNAGSADFRAYAILAGANFLGGLHVDDADVDRNREKQILARALVAAEEGSLDHVERARRYDLLAKELQTLKQAAAAQGDREREQRYFRHDVQARAKRPGEPRVARVAARLYAWTSDYGASIARPLAWLAGLVLVSALLFLWASDRIDPEPMGQAAMDRFWQALDFAVANSFRPFSVLESPRPGDERLGAQLLQWNAPTATLVRLWGSFQSLATIILLFLTGVALRRKFQIS